jgi:hypothetical protein
MDRLSRATKLSIDFEDDDGNIELKTPVPAR